MVKPEREDLGKAMAIVRKHKDRLYDMDVKEHRKKRSLDANAMLWSLINQMSAVLRIPPDEIYQGYIPDVGDNFTWHPEKPETVKQFSEEGISGGWWTMSARAGSRIYEGTVFLNAITAPVSTMYLRFPGSWIW